MGKLIKFLGHGLLVGSMALALMSGGAFGDTTSTTTTTTNADGSITTTRTTSSSSSVDVLGFRTPEMFMENNLLAGYGNIQNLMDAGGKLNPTLMSHRVIVKLVANDAIMSDEAMEPGNGFIRNQQGVAVTPFDPQLLDIETGTTVSFWSETGHHALESVGSDILAQSVPLVGGQIYNLTFLNPGHYRIQDGFVNGASGVETEGMIIRVSGPAKTSMDLMQMYGYNTTLETVDSSKTTITETVQQQQTTVQDSEVQVQGQQTQAPIIQAAPPPPPAPVAPVRVRDRDMK